MRLKQRALIERNASSYTSLNGGPRAVRLLNLLPGVNSDYLKCEFVYGNWDTPNYEALSYAWGHSRLRRAVMVNGSKFWITSNLYLALRNLRLEDKARVLWIDAICINQTDRVERTRQVQQMQSLYRHALVVIVWLGSAPRHVDQAFAQAYEPKWFKFSKRDELYIVSLSKLLVRPWWTRTWVIQELIVAKRVLVQCGVHSIPWEQFSRLVQAVPSVNEILPDRLVSICPRPKDLWLTKDRQLLESKNLARLRDENQNGIDRGLGLLGLAYMFRRKEATDGRDKLYALLGLPQSPKDILIEPDYEKEEDSVYRQFARAWINRYHSLLVIAVPRDDYMDAKRFPSFVATNWYPRWSSYTGRYTQDWTIPFWDLGIEPEMPIIPWHRSIFSAAGGHPAPNCTHHANKIITQFQGFTYDTVTAVGDAFSFTRKYWATSLEMRVAEWKQVIMSSTGKEETEVQESFHYTLTAGLFNALPIESDMYDSYQRARNSACQNRRFFITSKGSLGLGPAFTKIYDKVCVLLGADVPFVLREANCYLDEKREIISRPQEEIPQSAKGGPYPLWELVGESYVHEVMNYKGDIREDIKDGMLVLEDFCLV